MTHAVLVSFAAGLLVATATSDASQSRCPPSIAREAEVKASSVRSWKELHSAFRKYRKCDEGSVGEAFSDSVGRLLSAGDGGLKELSALCRKDPEFERFVIRHIDETIPVDTLDMINSNAADRCPKGATRLCAALRTASQR